MERRDKVVLKKILSELEIAEKEIAIYPLDEFLASEVLKRAGTLTVINVGEYVKALTFTLRQAHPHIPWKAIAGFRDIAAHKYQSLRMDDVYETITADFPELYMEIKKILEEA